MRPLGGGTALMLMMKAGVFAPSRLVSLRKITALKRIAVGADGGLVIGALTPLSDVEHSAEVARRAGVIVRTMRRLSNVRVRNVATIGGNLAHGDPHMDLPPVLMALDAAIVVIGRGGERMLKVENLFAGYYETVLKPGELITELRIPAQGKRRAAYLKVTTGAADDWPALGVAVSFEADGKAVRDVRVVASAATEKAIRLKASGSRSSPAPPSTTPCWRAPAMPPPTKPRRCRMCADRPPYKRELLRVYVRRAVRQALDGQHGRERATDGDHIDPDDDFRRPGRPLAAAARSPREGHRTGRIHPQSAAAGHAVRQDIPLDRRPWPDQVDRHQRRQRRCRASTASSPRRTCARSSRTLITARPSTTSRSSPSTRCTMSASPSRWCWRTIPMWPNRPPR